MIPEKLDTEFVLMWEVDAPSPVLPHTQTPIRFQSVACVRQYLRLLGHCEKYS